MKNTAPVWMGIAAIAGLVGIIATGVALVLYEFPLIAALFVGALVAGVAALALAIGWRAPADRPMAAPSAKPAPAPKAAAAPAPAAAAPAAAPAVAAPAAVAPVASASAEASKPQMLTAARGGVADDLKMIKGVGPKLEKTLHAMGIFHFDQIAAWGPAEQAWVDDNLEGFKGRATRDDWVGQATTLAAGGTTDFAAKVKDGGVY